MSSLTDQLVEEARQKWIEDLVKYAFLISGADQMRDVPVRHIVEQAIKDTAGQSMDELKEMVGKRILATIYGADTSDYVLDAQEVLEKAGIVT